MLGRGSLLAYLVHMTLRIVEIHRVLKPTGSFYLHCDPTASHYLKLVLDAVFCGQGGEYVNEIVWQRQNSKGLAFTRYARNHDVILFYAKSPKWLWNPSYTEHNEKYVDGFYKFYEEGTGRRYRLADLTNPNKNRPNLTYEFLGVTRVWRWTKDRMQRAYEDGIVLQSKPGNVPQLKRYLDEQEGNPVDDNWVDIRPVQSSSGIDKHLGYPTQKPEALLERVIRASSNEGDTVLDAYCGCGTTVAVAQRLNRRWIGVDITYQSISLILKRLQDKYPADWAQIEADILLDGVPRDLASAVALANRKDDKTRKEFEKWAVLTYSNNQARINEKKGADAGIDGIAYFLIGREGSGDTNGKAIFQVKSGGSNRATLATLNSDRLREKAEFGFLITMDLPTKAMRDEIAAAGKYRHPMLNREDDRIQVITVAEILRGDRLDLPMARTDAVKSAAAASDDDRQRGLDL